METFISDALTYLSTLSAHEQNALIGGSLVFVGYIIYWFATAFGKTRPNRITWGVLSLVGFAIAVNYWVATDASPNAKGLAVAHFVGAFGTYLLSLRYGQVYGKDDRKQKTRDRLCFTLAVLSLALWQTYVWGLFSIENLFGFPMISIALWTAILADFFGLLPTIRKAWNNPVSESLIAWTLTVGGEVVSLFAIQNWASLDEVSYPVYLLIANGIVLLFLLFRPRAKTVDKEAP